MKVSYLKNLIKDMPDDEEMFVLIYDKEDLEMYLQDEAKNIAPAQWQKIVGNMMDDDALWSTASETFAYYVDKESAVVVKPQIIYI